MPPAAGKIIGKEEIRGIKLVRYQRSKGVEPELRIPEPAKPQRCKSVEITPGEGPTHLVGKTINCRETEGSNPITVATVEMIRLGRVLGAPVQQGYLKIDFTIHWEDDWSYGGRFDITRDGKDDGHNFRESVMWRLRFYAGLHCPHHMTEEQYERVLAPPHPVDYFQHILTKCDL